MNRAFVPRLAAALLVCAAAASATDLQILCPDGARVRVDGADAGVCSAVEEGRFLRDLEPGGHVVEITVPGGTPQSHEIELDKVVPGRLDVRAEDGQAKPTGSLYIQCIPQRCTVRLAETDIEIDEEDLRLQEVPVGRYVFRFQRGKKTLEAVAFVKEGKPAGVRADFLAGHAGIMSASEIPRLEETRWKLAQTWEATLREKQMWDQFHAEIRRMEALRKGQPAEKTPPPL